MRALETLDAAARRSPENPRLSELRGRMATEARDMAAAARKQATDAGAAGEPVFDQAVETNARARAHIEGGRVSDGIRAFWEAAARYERALMTAAPLRNVDELLKAGDRAKALEALSSALSTDPGHTGLRARLDVMRTDAGQAASTAETELRRLKGFNAADAGYRDAQRRRVNAQSGPPTPDKVRELWQVEEVYRSTASSIAGASEVEQQLATAERALEEGDYPTSIAAFRRILAARPGHPAAAAGLARAQRAAAAEAGLVAHQRVVELARQAQESYDRGDYDRAINALGAAIKLEPGNDALRKALTQSEQARKAEASLKKKTPR
jgi:tetratricopeptide (TPR) repeat protein